MWFFCVKEEFKFVERFKFWKNPFYGWCIKMEFVKVDGQGRIYLPRVVRETVGIKPETVLEITATKGRITLSVRKESVAESGRGIFKITRSIENVDKEIRERSLQRALGELSEIRGR